MKISKVIELVDEIKPNAFSNEAKILWLSECDGLVQTEIWLIAKEDVITYDENTGADTALLVDPPHDKIYQAYLMAMIDFANGEYNKYQNTMQIFNTWLREYGRWYAQRYRPACEGAEPWRGYYFTAYGIAVKHGYEGTEDEWLAMLYEPVNTANQALRAVTDHTDDSVIHVTVEEKLGWDAAKAHADTDHAPADAEPNQNAFGGVRVGDATISAGSESDSFIFAGENVTLVADAAEKKITVGVTKGNVIDALGYTPSSVNAEYAAAGVNLGLVKSGGDVTIVDGVISVNDDSHGHTELADHIADKNNPHGISKGQIGLGNVPNVATNDQTPTYSQSPELLNLVSGEKLSVSFGKIVRGFAELISHLANKSNPHDVTAEQTGARPDTWTPTAADVGARANTWLPNIAEIGAAPAGYGLGGLGKNCSDCNKTTASGFYSLMGASLVNGPGTDGNEINYGNMLVLNRHNEHITQIVFRANMMVLRYSTNNGSTWTEWEWVNPPMAPNTEYRTTKRHNGKPVYTKLIKHTFTATTGNANGVTTFAINGGCSVVADIISLSAVFVGYNGDKYIVPTMGGNGNVWLGVNRVSSGNLYTVFVIVNDVFSTGSHGEVIYEYTKTTD